MSSTQATQTRRRTLPSAIGEPMVWLTGGALVVCVTMIVLLVGMVVVNGSMTFWPRAIEQVTLDDGTVLLGIATEHEQSDETGSMRTLYRVGNRDIGQESFRWIDDESIVNIETPTDAVMLEREAWGVWFGVPVNIIRVRDGEDDTVLAQNSAAVLEAYGPMHKDARKTTAKIERLKKSELGRINGQIETLRLDIQQAEIEFERVDTKLFRLSWGLWIVLGVLACGFVGLVYRCRDMGTALGASNARQGQLIRTSGVVAAVMLLMTMWIAAPWAGHSIDAAQLEEMRGTAQTQEVALLVEYDEVITRIRAIEDEDHELRLVIVEPTSSHFSPVSQTLGDEPMYMSQVVRLVQANSLSTTGKFGVFFSRWWEYLSTNPREANTEGGVYPVIVGTVVLTLLLTIFVTPLGVIAALYLREYAKQGFVTSLIRIAVNNLAGVPSIVYGVFGLGFFCYTVGGYVDTGASESVRMDSSAWWGMFVFVGMLLMLGFGLKLWSKPDPGKVISRSNQIMQRLSWLVWAAVLVLVVLLVTRTPYFHGFFEARAQDGTPTFGARGMLWAALTLALLTLPVVIVATEEAIAAVPNSMREGSYGCGASKWQTIWRIVLPGAMPGILTGAILAMARGAGEVAPLMLVGAVKLNQDLPISTQAPFIHADQSFMHLGFHIFDLGFQSPDSQAARPMVWTTTLLFLTIVFALNFTAIMLRSRLRAKMAGPTV
ncbi:MAG: ABC transporter permease subunit [Phycisphaerales bacterium]|nr:ABC transporter permease subunit [Phycisphaerales bacterium]